MSHKIIFYRFDRISHINLKLNFFQVRIVQFSSLGLNLLNAIFTATRLSSHWLVLTNPLSIHLFDLFIQMDSVFARNSLVCIQKSG